MIIVKQTDEVLLKAYEHFDPQGNSLGYLNEVENLYLRTQICKYEVEGYYFKLVDGTKVFIDSNGRIVSSDEVYPEINHLFDILIIGSLL